MELLEKLCKIGVKALSEIPQNEFSKIVGKGAGGEKTKLIDFIVEKAIISYLESIEFKGRLISEEIGEKKFGNEEYPLIILDPIDGTTNAIRGIIPYSISIAISNGPNLSDIYAGVVMEIPSERLFKAEKGKGAYLNNKRIYVNNIESIKKAIIGIDIKAKGKINKNIFPIIFEAKLIRIIGSAALELCYVASGALDLYIDMRELLRITDIAAAYIILKEAGATILDSNGIELNSLIDLSKRISIITGNKKLCEEAISLIRRNFKY
ncbi:MAG: inositol monophosphatase family protein [Candidatus Methanomethylicaceae archaeon]